MAALDIPKFYRKARNQFAVRDKITGQILGYANLLPGIAVEDGQLQFIPWLEDDLLTYNPDLAVQDPRLPVVPSFIVNKCEILQKVNLSLSLSSDDGSRNATNTTDTAVEHLPTKQADFNANISFAKARPSTPEPGIKVCKSPALSSASEISIHSVKSSSTDSIIEVSPFSSVIVKEVKDMKVIEAETRTEAGRSESKRQFVGESASVRDLKTVKLEEKNEKVDCNKPFLPGVAGRYDNFWEFVKGKDSAMDIRRRKVTCLLCGKEYSYGNIRRHIQTFHEDHVICDICNIQFNARRTLSEHKRKVHNKQWMEENDVKTDDIKIDEKVTLPVTPPVGVSGPPQSTVKVVRNSTPDPMCNKVSSKLVSVTLTSDTVKGVSLKMGLKEDAKMKKAMRKFGNRFKVDYKSLKFFQGSTELTGREVVADVNGSEVIVIGEINN